MITHCDVGFEIYPDGGRNLFYAGDKLCEDCVEKRSCFKNEKNPRTVK